MFCVLILLCCSSLQVIFGEPQNDAMDICGKDQHDCQNANKTCDINDKVCWFETFILKKKQAACILPPQPDNGMYEVTNLLYAQTGQAFDYVSLTVTCRQGFGIAGTGSTDDAAHKIYCVDGKWSQNMPKCVRFCKLDPDPSVRYTCLVSGTSGFKTCDKYVAPGVAVKPVCNTPVYHSSESLLYMNCVGGTWDYVAKCKAECGRITPEGEQLIIDGRLAKRGEIPWHVGIYRKFATTDPKNTRYKQVCGGTLINNGVVLSAAHCFWHEKQKMLHPKKFAAAVGKLYRDWNDKHDVDAQKSNVKHIILPRLFEGEAANFQEDIAIVVLATPVTYKTYVRPVCLSFDDNFDRWQLQQGKLGKVAGWGFTSSNGPAAEVLRVVDIPYVSTEACINNLPSTFREYLTGDKFCAGYTNGTALCRGDSGGGLTFADKELGIDRYYLRGIASAAPKDEEKSCSDRTYTIFTQITKHEQFIKQSLAALNKKSCSLSEFQCLDGNCVGLEAECDGKPDCADGSDEADDLCKAGNNELHKNSSACILPPFPPHAVYRVANLRLFRPGQALESFVITVTCDVGYGIENPDGRDNATNSQQVYCINGAWNRNMPKCIRLCEVQPDPSVKYVSCEIPGSGITTCPEYVPPGTKVVPECNFPDYCSYDILPSMTCLNGSWDYIARCQQVFCKLEPVPNTRYMCQDPETDQFKICDSIVRPGIIVKPICDAAGNGSITVLEDMSCMLGTWNKVLRCKTDSCQLSLTDPSIRYMCHNPETNLTRRCDSTVSVGTVVRPVCNTPYYLPTEPLRKMTCTDQSWDYVAKCRPDCGRVTTIKFETLDSVQKAVITREIIPWHVKITTVGEKKALSYDYGTLIRSDIVITGADSFYDVVRRTLDTFTRYRVEIRDLDKADKLQRSDVKSILVTDKIQYTEGVLEDIAALVLETPFVFNLYVSPICVNFDIDFEEHQLAYGFVSKLGYWGVSNKNRMTVIDINYCVNDLFSLQHIFQDKICFLYDIESVPVIKDLLGASLAMARNESGVTRYYFRGMLDNGCFGAIDTKPLCDYNYPYAWATKVSFYKKFLQQFL